MIVRTRAHARIALIGNPSDGYYGKTIACTIRNFSAQVTLWESPTLELVPHPRNDPTKFESLENLKAIAERDGYYGGLRLLFATCKKFKDFCDEKGIVLPERNFTITYETDIPRQVGLGGSSAIVTAAFKALMQFYGLDETHIPRPIQPNIILSVERDELGIAAGLQDRVAQVYDTLVYMDFSRHFMEQWGHGLYKVMDKDLLPPLFLAYVNKPSFSGRIHSNLRARYEAGDPIVLRAIEEWRELTDEAKEALEQRDYKRLAQLMNRNFDLRRKVLGDAALGGENLEMIEIGRNLGAPTKLPGSGGAVIGIFWDEEHFRKLKRAYNERGYACVKVEV